MERTWSLSCHDNRQLSEISESKFQPSGRFWSDLRNLVHMLDATIHPCFVNIPKQDTRFTGISFKFDDFSFAILCKILFSSPLKQIIFNNCSLSVAQINNLVSLRSLPHFQSLQIDWNPVENPMIFADLLCLDSKLHSLSLKSCNLDNESFFTICESLKTNKTLNFLDLYSNQISDLSKLSEALKENRSLVGLSLCSNNIHDENLSPLIGIIGKILCTEEDAQEFKRIEKEKAKKKVQEIGPLDMFKGDFTDEIEYNEESKEYFIMKNQVFRQFNLSLNKISNDHYLRLLLGSALKSFKVLITGNPLPESVKSSLGQAFAQNIIV